MRVGEVRGAPRRGPRPSNPFDLKRRSTSTKERDVARSRQPHVRRFFVESSRSMVGAKEENRLEMQSEKKTVWKKNANPPRGREKLRPSCVFFKDLSVSPLFCVFAANRRRGTRDREVK
jgi:hypothetical protein